MDSNSKIQPVGEYILTECSGIVKNNAVGTIYMLDGGSMNLATLANNKFYRFNLQRIVVDSGVVYIFAQRNIGGVYIDAMISSIGDILIFQDGEGILI